MSKPKARKASADTGRPKSTGPVLRPGLNLKMSDEYAAWLDGVNKESHIPKAVIVRLALELWAKEQGYPAPPSV